MDGESYMRFILALLLVLGLLALAAFLLRRSGLGPKLSRSRRLAALESLPVGPKHRLLLIRRDDVEHLLLLGPEGDLVVESHIPTAAGAPPRQDGLSDRGSERQAFSSMLGEHDQTTPAAITRKPSVNETN
jgi:flagellar protein FliO/FliZ